MLLPFNAENVLGGAGIDLNDGVSAPDKLLLQSDAARGEHAHGPQGDGKEPDAPLHEVPHGGHRLCGIAGTVQGYPRLARIEGDLDSLSLAHCEAPGIPEIADHLFDYIERFPEHHPIVDALARFLVAVEHIPHDHDADPLRGIPRDEAAVAPLA